MPENEVTDGVQVMPRQAPRRKRRERRSQKKINWSRYALLMVLVIATFGSILGNDLLWTEYDQTERAPYTSMEDPADALNIEMLRSRHILDTLSYFAEVRLGLPLAQVHRGINLGLHLLASLMLLRLLRTLEIPGAFAASLVFALHPAVVQPLFWPGYRTELFGLVVIIAALSCAIRSRNWFEYLLALMLTFMACLIHKAGLFIPAILALLIYLKKGNVHLQDYNRVLPMVCIALFTGAWIHSGPAAAVAGEGIPLYQAINHAGQSLFFFYQLALVPDSLALFYPYDTTAVEQTTFEFSILPFCVFLPLYVIALIKFRTSWSRGLILGLSAFMLLLIPGMNSHGLNIDGTRAHESYGLYVALPALMALIICGSRSIVERMEFAGRSLWFTALSLLIIVEVLLSGAFSYTLGDPIRMWQLQAEQWPKQWIPKVALINYAGESEDIGYSQSQLIRTLEELLEENPDLIKERRMLAKIYVTAGENNNALREYTRILRETDPDDAFLEEAATFLDRMGLRWEANNARKRMKTPPAE